ncbi:MAG: class I SAM-dependent methyltransferase [Ignavibacteriales bacterium]|nr:class I SAM-dependent methyltransferase [Ignavibacteriales bacterium]
MADRYYNYSRSEMLEFIPKECKRILEIGCGAGNFGRQLIEQRQAEVWGVEPITEAANAAAKVLNKVLNNFYEEDINLPEHYFDCIVFNDVLEHMVNPWNVLKFSKKFLRQDSPSFIVTSIPNFRYIRNMYEIVIQKDFEYKGELTLDRTHLRFFTYKSILRLFDEAGMKIIKIQGISPSIHPIFRIVNCILFNKLKDMKFLQYAVIAKF